MTKAYTNLLEMINNFNDFLLGKNKLDNTISDILEDRIKTDFIYYIAKDELDYDEIKDLAISINNLTHVGYKPY
jgi:hypothetical protein